MEYAGVLFRPHHVSVMGVAVRAQDTEVLESVVGVVAVDVVETERESFAAPL
ncbi:hypothetical protein GCM10023320_55910 [Pseudonocardia adelaidensis]|uniref:Uncharacterized protein n=1 Tax=Pseudonocardia adelaidensis TaxID=648754 RepID=A0ABP9NR53_9PSEU